MVEKVVERIKNLLEDKPEGYLKNSYENLLLYYTTTKWDRNIKDFVDKTKIRDARRGTDCSKVFPQLFEELNELE